MGKGVMIAVIGFLGIVLLWVLMPSFMSGVVAVQTNNITNSYNVSTNVTATTAVVTLTSPLFNDNTGHVLLMASDGGGGDNPVPNSYATATRALTMGGLDANKTRNVTVIYRADALGDYQGMQSVVPIFPIIGTFAIIVIVVALMYRAFT